VSPAGQRSGDCEPDKGVAKHCNGRTSATAAVHRSDMNQEGVKATAVNWQPVRAGSAQCCHLSHSNNANANAWPVNANANTNANANANENANPIAMQSPRTDSC